MVRKQARKMGGVLFVCLAFLILLSVTARKSEAAEPPVKIAWGVPYDSIYGGYFAPDWPDEGPHLEVFELVDSAGFNVPLLGWGQLHQVDVDSIDDPSDPYSHFRVVQTPAKNPEWLRSQFSAYEPDSVWAYGTQYRFDAPDWFTDEAKGYFKMDDTYGARQLDDDALNGLAWYAPDSGTCTRKVIVEELRDLGYPPRPLDFRSVLWRDEFQLTAGDDRLYGRLHAKISDTTSWGSGDTLLVFEVYQKRKEGGNDILLATQTLQPQDFDGPDVFQYTDTLGFQFSEEGWRIVKQKITWYDSTVSVWIDRIEMWDMWWRDWRRDVECYEESINCPAHVWLELSENMVQSLHGLTNGQGDTLIYAWESVHEPAHDRFPWHLEFAPYLDEWTDSSHAPVLITYPLWRTYNDLVELYQATGDALTTMWTTYGYFFKASTDSATNGGNLQEQVDDILVNHDIKKAKADSLGIRLAYLAQSMSAYNGSETLIYRYPTAYEQEMAMWMGPAHGANIVGVFSFGTSYRQCDTSSVFMPDYPSINGIPISPTLWIDCVPSDSFYIYTGPRFGGMMGYIMGLIRYDGTEEEWVPVQPNFNVVARVNAEFDLVGWLFSDTSHWQTVVTCSTGALTNWEYIDSMYSANFSEPWIEVATFQVSTQVDPHYLLLLNRRCLGSEKQWVTIWFDTSAATGLGTDKLIFEDEVTHERIYSYQMGGSIPMTVHLNPGQGKVFKIASTDKIDWRDTLDCDLTYMGDISAIGDAFVPAGCTLRVKGPAKIAFLPEDSSHTGFDGSLCELIIEGTISADGICDTVKFTTSDATPEPGDWYGIRLTPQSSGDFSNCIIKYGEFGIRSNQAKLDVDSCEIWDSYQHGIFASGTDVSVYRSKIQDSRLDGIRCVKSHFDISHNDIYESGRYGIFCDSTAAEAADSVYIRSNNIINSSPEDTDAGVDVRENDRYRVSGNAIYRFSGAGIDCRNASGVLVGNIIDSCVYYGLLCRNSSSPLVRHNLIKRVGYGVTALGGSYPDLGDTSQTGDGNNSVYAISTGIRVRNVNSSPADTIKAENNWWGTATPHDTMFVGPVDWHPYLTEPPNSWEPPKTIAQGEAELPRVFALHQNYPNPFNPATTIKYDLPRDSHVLIEIYNILGQRVVKLRDDHEQPGYKVIHWNGRNSSGGLIATGVYFYLLKTDEFRKVKKMVMIR